MTENASLLRFTTINSDSFQINSMTYSYCNLTNIVFNVVMTFQVNKSKQKLG